MDKIMMSVDIATIYNPILGQMVYNTDSYTIMIYDGNTWRYLNCQTENKYSKRKRIISKLLSEN